MDANKKQGTKSYHYFVKNAEDESSKRNKTPNTITYNDRIIDSPQDIMNAFADLLKNRISAPLVVILCPLMLICMQRIY